MSSTRLGLRPQVHCCHQPLRVNPRTESSEPIFPNCGPLTSAKRIYFGVTFTALVFPRQNLGLFVPNNGSLPKWPKGERLVRIVGFATSNSLPTALRASRDWRKQ